MANKKQETNDSIRRVKVGLKPKNVKAAVEGAMTAAGAYSSVAEKVGLKPKNVKAAVEGFMLVAATQVKKSGAFKVGGMLNLKLKVKPARPARKGVNPFTK